MVYVRSKYSKQEWVERKAALHWLHRNNKYEARFREMDTKVILKIKEKLLIEKKERIRKEQEGHVNVVQFYRQGGKDEWTTEHRQLFRDRYRMWNEALKRIYYDEKRKVGRDTMRKIIFARKDELFVNNLGNVDLPSKRFVNTWLKQQLTHQLTTRGMKPKSIQAIMANYPNELLQTDTIFILKKDLSLYFNEEKPPGYTHKEWETQKKDIEKELEEDGMKLGVDYVGAITMIDALSRRGYAFPVKKQDSVTTVRALCPERRIPPKGERMGLMWQAEDWAKRQGFNKTNDDMLRKGKKFMENRFVIRKLQSDKGSEFMLNFRQRMKELNEKWEDKKLYRHVFSFEGKPQANGMVERFNGTIKKIIMKMLPRNESGQVMFKDWHKVLDQALEIYNSNVHNTTSHAPNDVTPENFVQVGKNIRDVARRKRPFTTINYKVGDYVRIFNYNKSKQKGYPNYSWSGGPLVKVIKNNASLRNSLMSVFEGVYMIDKVYEGSNPQAGGSIGKSTSYGIVANWSKEATAEGFTPYQEAGGTQPSGIKESQKAPLIKNTGTLFDNLNYPAGSYMRKFVSEELLNLSVETRANNGLRNDMQNTVLLTLPITNSDPSEKSSKKDDAPEQRRPSRRIAEIVKQKNKGRVIDFILDIRNGKALVQWQGVKKPEWMSVNVIKEDSAYAKYIMKNQRRREYNLRKRKK